MENTLLWKYYQMLVRRYGLLTGHLYLISAFGIPDEEDYARSLTSNEQSTIVRIMQGSFAPHDFVFLGKEILRAADFDLKED